jgi:ABC-type antimicrobial peptide transport system permease subunit
MYPACSFTLTFEIIFNSLLFPLIIIFVGGVMPAFRAARKNIVAVLRVT